MPDDSPPLKILQVLEPSGGGSGRHFIDLCRGLAARGQDVTAIYSPRRAEAGFVAELKSLDLRAVHAIDMRRSPHPQDFKAGTDLRQIVRNDGPFDIVHGHSSKAGFLVRMGVGGAGRALRVYTPHAFRTMDPTLGLGGRLIFGAAEAFMGRFLSEAVICVSEDERVHARDALRIPEDRLHTIVNGVARPDPSTRQGIRTALGFSDADFVYGFIGRLSAQKAPERLVEAFGDIAGAFPAARLLMIGSGELEAAVRRLVSERGLSERLVLTTQWTGAEAVAAFDAFVMPSRYEAMSYAMLEAAAAGKPIIVTAVGGASTVVEDGINGRIVANRDSSTELADAMRAFADAPAREAYQAAAQARSAGFSLAVMVDETLALYRRLRSKA